MNCKNCKSDLRVIKKGIGYCEKCNEIFRIDGEKQEVVSDKNELWKNIQEELGKLTTNAKEIFSKFVTFEDDNKKSTLEEEYFN